MEKLEQINSEGNSVEKIKPIGIIAGAPGVGKSTMTRGLSSDITVADMEPTPYTRSQDWPDNYIEDIVSKTAKNDLVLITTNPEVIRELRKED